MLSEKRVMTNQREQAQNQHWQKRLHRLQKQLQLQLQMLILQKQAKNYWVQKLKVD